MVEKRPRISWSKKAIPLKSSTLFSKPKHSEEWHHSVDATAGVLHPSDPKFPSSILRNHTATYLKKKSRLTQTDTDIRLAILVTSHEARDVAVAAAAHAMTASSLRALLPVDVNVMQGSYWGLKMWLQCLIAANEGNPASVTDLEASWARNLLPFATQGPRAAEWYLVGMCRALRESSIPNMDVLPEFGVLMRRAITDHSTRLEGLRLRCEWASAYEAVLWMVELAKTSPAVTPPGHLLPEHILDSHFPMWRLWTYWKPQVQRIKLLASSNPEKLAMVSDLVALEGPDLITGVEGTLREGLVVRFPGLQAFVQWRGIVIEVPDREKKSLKNVLEKLARSLETVIAATGPGHQDLFELFRYLTIAIPITTTSLEIFEAACKVPYTPSNDVYNAVREIYKDREQLGGQHILALQHLFTAFEDHRSVDLRGIFLTERLRTGTETCVQRCQEVIRTHIDKGLPWTKLALEYHTFCTILKSSEQYWPLAYQTIKVHPRWPSTEQMKAVVEIHDAAHAHRLRHPVSTSKTTTVESSATASDSLKDNKASRHPLEIHIEAYCVDRVLGGDTISHSSQRTMTAILQVWESSSKPQVDIERRELAIHVSEIVGTDFILRCRCLAEIATGSELLGPSTFNKDLLSIMYMSRSELSQAIVDLTNLLAEKKVRAQCWRDLLYMWLESQCETSHSEKQTVLEYSLQSMKTVQWLQFMDHIEALFADLLSANSTRKPMPSILQPVLFDCKTQISKHMSTLTRLETVIGGDHGPPKYVLASCSWLGNLTEIFECLHEAEGKPVEIMMQRLVGQLGAVKRNDQEVKEALLNFTKTSPEIVEACCRIWDAKHGWLDIPGLPADQNHVDDTVAHVATSTQLTRTLKDVVKPSPEEAISLRRRVPLSVVEVMVAGWLQRVDINERDRKAITSVAGILGVCVNAQSSSTWSIKLTEATVFWKGIENEIMRESARLESLQKALKAKDPRGTALLLQELSIPYNSQLDEEMMNLPAGIMDVVERVGDTGVEISFPLTTFTELRKSAMGVPIGAHGLVLRLTDYASEELPPSFCVHFNNDENLDTLSHTPWRCAQDSRSPHKLVCTTAQTALVWQLNRILHTRLKVGNVGIADLHKLVKQKLVQLGQLCISCETSHGTPKASLRRATPCKLLSCARLWYSLPLDVRIPEIRTDTFAVDAMLTAVYAAAMSGRSELLPSCPIHSTEAIKTILNALPRLSLISHAVNISAVLQSYHRDGEKLISWACVHHRGYIASATGLCKIHNLPTGTHQFVLANAKPGLENGFVSKLGRSHAQTTVLFHGTTFDRLPAILAQGLKVCSGTSLQRTGAAHGKGIYMAEEPATSLTYASPTTSWRNSGLTNMRLLLGCEVVGAGRIVSPGIHVLTEENSVIVRYIFFLTSQATMPIANHVVPAMASGMSALRKGAI
jgi:hypothetical protein